MHHVLNVRQRHILHNRSLRAYNISWLHGKNNGQQRLAAISELLALRSLLQIFSRDRLKLINYINPFVAVNCRPRYCKQIIKMQNTFRAKMYYILHMNRGRMSFTADVWSSLRTYRTNRSEHKFMFPKAKLSSSFLMENIAFHSVRDGNFCWRVIKKGKLRTQRMQVKGFHPRHEENTFYLKHCFKSVDISLLRWSMRKLEKVFHIVLCHFRSFVVTSAS